MHQDEARDCGNVTIVWHNVCGLCPREHSPGFALYSKLQDRSSQGQIVINGWRAEASSGLCMSAFLLSFFQLIK